MLPMIRELTVDATKMAQAQAEEFAALRARQPSYQGSGTVVTVTLFATEEHWQAAQAVLAAGAQRLLEPLGAATTRVVTGTDPQHDGWVPILPHGRTGGTTKPPRVACGCGCLDKAVRHLMARQAYTAQYLPSRPSRPATDQLRRWAS